MINEDKKKIALAFNKMFKSVSDKHRGFGYDAAMETLFEFWEILKKEFNMAEYNIIYKTIDKT